MTSTHQIQRILLPIEDSQGAEAAIDYAVLLATALGVPVLVVHVDEAPHPMVGIVPGATVDGDLALEQQHTRGQFAEVVTAVLQRGFHDVTTLQVAAPAIADTIVATATATDLIVMATHARTGLPRVVLGSIAEQVVRRAPCPVLTVHMPAR